MNNLLLSRARLRRDVPAAALWRQLAPEDDDRRVQASHRLVWTLFSDAPERARDFLWRESEPGTFYFLSRRPPEDRHNLFDVDAPKIFAPELTAGDVLQFTLRANATVARKQSVSGGGRSRGKPCDVVMDTLHEVPKGAERAGARPAAVQAAGRAWLDSRGARSGFRVVGPSGTDADAGPGACVTGYRVLRLDDRNEKMRIGVLDFTGRILIEDPQRFMEALAQGFGRAKAFGCGLMLIRRA